MIVISGAVKHFGPRQTDVSAADGAATGRITDIIERKLGECTLLTSGRFQ
jgi:hypothetical protein